MWAIRRSHGFGAQEASVSLSGQEPIELMGGRRGAQALDARDARLIERLRGELPLTDHPFADVGADLGMGEDEVLDRLQRLFTLGVLTCCGPLIQVERAGGCFVLAALEVPPERFDEVAAIVNAVPEVAHNYRREHALNMWFMVAGATAAVCAAVLECIARDSGLPVHVFPKEREYFVELNLPVLEPAEAAARPGSGAAPCG
jgi:DNA-binding Lrp family transcriptional regulator